MSRTDLVRVAGVVTDVLGGGSYSIKLVQGGTVQAKLSGRMRKFHIRVIPGDRVTVGLSPYDPTHGLILERERLGQQQYNP